MNPLMYVNRVPIYKASDLPEIPPPTKVVVSNNCVVIDDRILIKQPISLRVFKWLCDCVDQWFKEDPSDTNRDQLMAIVETCHEQIIDYGEMESEQTRQDILDSIVTPYLNHLLKGVASVVECKAEIDQGTIEFVLACPGSRVRPSLQITGWEIEPATAESHKLSQKWKPKDCPWVDDDESCRMHFVSWQCSGDPIFESQLGQLLPKSFHVPISIGLNVMRILFGPA